MYEPVSLFADRPASLSGCLRTPYLSACERTTSVTPEHCGAGGDAKARL